MANEEDHPAACHICDEPGHGAAPASAPPADPKVLSGKFLPLRLAELAPPLRRLAGGGLLLGFLLGRGCARSCTANPGPTRYSLIPAFLNRRFCTRRWALHLSAKPGR